MRSCGLAPALALATAVAAPARGATLTEIDRAVSRYLSQGQSDSAAALVSAAIDLAVVELGDSLAVAAYVDSLGVRFFEAYHHDTGVKLLERGMALRESVLAADDFALAAPLEQLSTAYYIVGRLNDAVAPQERAIAIKIATLGADDPSVAWSRYLFSLLYYRLTRYADAERELRAALHAFEPNRQKEPMPVAETERVLGEVCRELNRYDDAETWMLEALSLARGGLPEGDPDLVVFMNSLAGFYKDQARYDESELLLEEALEIRTRAKLDHQLAIPTLNLAEIYRLQGRTDDAIPLYQRSIAIARKTLPPLEVAEFHNQLAAAYEQMGRFRDAENEYRRALAVVDSSSDASPQVVAQFKNDLGAMLAREGHRDEGESLLKEAIALREAVFGANHPLVAVSLMGLARAQAGLFDAASARSPRDRDAAALLDRALAIFDSTDAEPEGRIEARVARAQLYLREKRVDRAAETMAKALADVEALRPFRGGGGEERIEFIRRYVDAYDRMTAWQIELGSAKTALEYSERRRARVLVDQLTGPSRGASGEGSRDALERLRGDKAELEKQIGTCQAQARSLRDKPRLSRSERSQLAAIESRCDRMAGELQRTNERIRAMAKASTAPAVSAVPSAAYAPDGDLLLVYHVGAESSALFVVEAGAGDVRAHPLRVSGALASSLGIPAGALTRASLQQLLSGYDASGKPAGLGLVRQLTVPVDSSRVTGARALAGLHERLRAVFSLLVPAAVWSRIRVVPEVTIVPDGPLSAFPFEACVVAGPGAAVFWLDEGPVIRYAPSIATLDALAATATRITSRGVLSVCNPRYALANPEPGSPARDELAPLPGTERETEGVVAAFGKDRVAVLRGDAATEAAVRGAIDGKEIVHLATHGIVSPGRSDLMSALAFTPAPSSRHDLRDDGFLHLFEIYDLPVSAELVVLSACESSTGSYVAGEGVMALSRGFLSAGARRVVATQWKVDDAASALLVGDFLSRVARAERSHGPIDYARALRDAKRSVRMRSQWSQPFYWAAFVLSGAR